MEKWLQSEYPGYEISCQGNLRSVDRYVTRSDTGKVIFVKGRNIKHQIDRYGYCQVSLSVGGKKIMARIHRIVAKAFLSNPESLREVNHVDGNKKNNRLENLEWVNTSTNQLHAIATGLKVIKTGKESSSYTGPVHVFKNGNLVAITHGHIDLRNLGFDPRLVFKCTSGERKTHKGHSFVKVKEI